MTEKELVQLQVFDTVIQQITTIYDTYGVAIAAISEILNNDYEKTPIGNKDMYFANRIVNDYTRLSKAIADTRDITEVRKYRLQQLIYATYLCLEPNIQKNLKRLGKSVVNWSDIIELSLLQKQIEYYAKDTRFISEYAARQAFKRGRGIALVPVGTKPYECLKYSTAVFDRTIAKDFNTARQKVYKAFNNSTRSFNSLQYVYIIAE